MFKAISAELAIEKIFIAEEIKTVSPVYLEKMMSVIEETCCEVEFVVHAELKEMSRG